MKDRRKNTYYLVSFLILPRKYFLSKCQDEIEKGKYVHLGAPWLSFWKYLHNIIFLLLFFCRHRLLFYCMHSHIIHLTAWFCILFCLQKKKANFHHWCIDYIFHISVIYLFIHTPYVYQSTLSVRAPTINASNLKHFSPNHPSGLYLY